MKQTNNACVGHHLNWNALHLTIPITDGLHSHIGAHAPCHMPLQCTRGGLLPALQDTQALTCSNSSSLLV